MKNNIKKYLGIVIKETESMGGLDRQVLTKTYNKKETLDTWFNMYPNSKHIILDNTLELNLFFEEFYDLTPVTEEEKKEAEETRKIYKKLMEN
jgi:hypothetical protein